MKSAIRNIFKKYPNLERDQPTTFKPQVTYSITQEINEGSLTKWIDYKIYSKTIFIEKNKVCNDDYYNALQKH